MSQALVSVIMPCFNAGRMLPAALSSVLQQSYPNIEIIFVDNNSTDGSAAYAEKIAAESSRPFRYTSCAAQGANRARNHGFALAQGAYIQWMDADDTLDPDKIALQVEALATHPQADIAYGDWTAQWQLPDQPPRSKRHTLRQVEDQLSRMLMLEWYPPPIHLIRRGAADRLHSECGWLAGRPVATDIEYFGLAALLGMRFRHVAGSQATYNIWSDNQISSGTPYPTRIAHLRDIYRRLLQFAETSAARLTASQKALLRQNWDVWSMPRGSVVAAKTQGRGVKLRHTKTGREMQVRPWEAEVALVMTTIAAERAILHHAQQISRRAPKLGGDLAAIITTLERFRREGFLELVAGAGAITVSEPEPIKKAP